MVKPDFGQPDLARILEPSLVGAAGLAIFGIGVDHGHRAAAVGHAGDGAAFVGQQPAAVAGAAAFQPDQRFIHPRPMHIAAQNRAGTVKLGDQIVAVIDKPRRRPGLGDAGQAANRVIGQARPGAAVN